jgi:hypothetical protein
MYRITTRDILVVTAVCAIATTAFAQFCATQTEATTALRRTAYWLDSR